MVSTRCLLPLASALLLAVVASGALSLARADEDAHEHVAEAQGVRLVHAWSRATSDGSALVFVEIENGGDAAVTIDGGSAAIAETVELVGFQLVDGAPDHVPLDAVTIEPGVALDLKPDGLALRLGGLREALVAGEEFAMTVSFGSFNIPVEVVVEAADATAHSHAGHSH